MKLKTKRKLNYILGWMLGIVFILTTLLVAYLYNKLIEVCVTFILYHVYRGLFEKQYHANSVIKCFIITNIVFFILIKLSVKFSISILITVLLTFIFTVLSYYVQEYLDSKILVKMYTKRLLLFDSKCIENLTEDELIKALPKIRYNIIHIVYGYLHRDFGITASGYAYRNNISEATLYRYVKQVKEKYENLGLNS